METESTIGGTPTFELLSQETKDKMEKTLEKKVGTKKGEKKKFTRKFYNRCYPNVLVQYFEQMKKDKEIDKMNKLKSLGFFAMTQLKITKTHNKFITWVCENFISSQLKIRLEGDITMSISENDVHRVYKLPRGPRRIDRCSKEEMDALKKELGFKIGSKRSENLHLIDIQSRLPSYKNDETWQKAILLLSIGYVLCPSKNLTVSLKYARCLSKLDEVCEYNWCEHLLQHLQRNIQPGTLYPNGDIQFLMVHVMDILKQGDLSTSEPTCMKWSNEQLFHCFDKLAKGDGFGKAIAKKSTRKVEGCNHMHSDYSVGVGNAAQMPSARSCNSLEQCHQYMDYRKYNISAWTNCLKDLEKNEKELLKDASGQADTVGSRLKKRKKSLTTNDAEEEKFTKKPDRDMEELDQLLNDCEILQDKICNQDDEREKKKMVVVFVNDSQDSCEGKGRPKRETKESKFKRTPFREKIKITLPPFDENEKELLSYAFDKGKNHHEVLFQMNMEKRFNLDREAILTLENKNFIVSAIIDHCTRAMNVYNLKKGECKRLSLTIAATTSMTTTTKKEKFLDKRTEEECIAWFVKTIESSPFWSLDDFKSEYLQYVFFPIYFQSHFTVFVVDLKEGKGQYLNSLAEVQMSNVVKDAANCVARSLFCFLKKAGVGNFEDWNGSWEIAPVPQQTPRSNACGWFVVKFIEEWNGEPASMATFRGWSNLDNTQRNKIITHGRQQICLSILKSEYNDIDFKDLQMKKKRTTESLRMEVQQEKKKRQSLRIQLEQEKK